MQGEVSNVIRWQDPDTTAFSCEIDQQGQSCDNHVLFSAEAVRLGLMSESYFDVLVGRFTHDTGFLVRYPNKLDFTSWDDYVGAMAVSRKYATLFLKSFSKSKWKTPNGSWLGRFPILSPTARAGAGLTLGLIDQLKVFVAYGFNLFEAKEETSGKIILWVAAPLFERQLFPRLTIKLWRLVQSKRYKGGVQEMFQIYFKPKNGVTHPFVAAASCMNF